MYSSYAMGLMTGPNKNAEYVVPGLSPIIGPNHNVLFQVCGINPDGTPGTRTIDSGLTMDEIQACAIVVTPDRLCQLELVRAKGQMLYQNVKACQLLEMKMKEKIAQLRMTYAASLQQRKMTETENLLMGLNPNPNGLIALLLGDSFFFWSVFFNPLEGKLPQWLHLVKNRRAYKEYPIVRSLVRTVENMMNAAPGTGSSEELATFVVDLQELFRSLMVL